MFKGACNNQIWNDSILSKPSGCNILPTGHHFAFLCSVQGLLWVRDDGREVLASLIKGKCFLVINDMLMQD